MRSFSHLLLVRLCVLVLGVVAIGVLPQQVSAHAHIVRSEPARGSIQPSAPEQIHVWFSEPIDVSKSKLEIYDEQRQRVDRDDLRIDPSDATHVTVSLQELVDGTYTVSWTAASFDGHTLTGTQTFRVGQARVPGAAATESSNPSPAAIALRWVNLLGLSTVVGWFLLRILGLGDDERRRTVALIGGAAALLADVLLIAVQAYLPAGGAASQTLLDAARGMHWSWIVRVAFELTVLVFLFLRSVSVIALVISVLAVLSLTLTSHAAATDRLRGPALVANSLHLEAVALWIGGVIQLALLPSGQRLATAAARRFSALALILAPMAIVTGLLNAGVTLPALDSAWTSTYGRILLVKSAVVILVLAFGWLNRQRVATGIERLTRATRSLKTEAALGGTAILLASTLALWSPPAATQDEPLHLRVATGDGNFAHLEMKSPSAGERDFDLWLTDESNQPVQGVGLALITFSMLERPVDLATVRAEPAGDGRWAAADVPVTIKGWWQASVRFEGLGTNPELNTAQFVLLLPDPNLSRRDGEREENADARQIYKDAIARITELSSVSMDEHLSDGVGNSVTTSYTYASPDRLRYVTGNGHESVAIGDRQYFRESDGAWTERERATPLAFPESFPAFYSGAQGFTLGRIQEIDGEQCQVIAFSVPSVEGRGEAWYLWWVGIESKRVRQESMVAYYHYMTTRYGGYNAPVDIEAPMVASP